MWVWDQVGIFLYVLISLLDQLLVGLLAPGFIAMPLYSHQAPYFRQIRPDFTLWHMDLSPGWPPSVLGWFRGVNRHPYCGVLKLKKSKKRKIRISRSGSGLGDSGPSGGWPWGPKRSIEAKKAKKKFPENPDFPDPDPDFRIYVHAVAIGGR